MKAIEPNPRRLLVVPLLLAAAVVLSGCLRLGGESRPTFYERVTDDGQANAHTLYERGMEAMKQGKHSRAIRFFKQSAELAPENPKPWSAMIRAKLEMDRPQAAVGVAEKAREKFPDEFEVTILHSVALMSSGRLAEADRLLASLSPENNAMQAYVERARGDLAYRAGRLDLALEFWTNSLVLAPAQPTLAERIASVRNFQEPSAGPPVEPETENQ